jgi:hypothetical protein
MILGDGTEVRMGNTYGQGEVGDERGSKEMDRCPLTATIPLMRLESEQYFQGRQIFKVYIDKFKELIDFFGYIYPIMIVLKFCRGLNATTQDQITESGID